MTLVVDASAIVAALINLGAAGKWAEQNLAADHLAAPELMTVEAANILRRAELRAELSSEGAGLAYRDLLDLRIELFPLEPLADRIWELRKTVISYDAWYVALAESLGGQLLTLDQRLAGSPGPRCEFLTP